MIDLRDLTAQIVSCSHCTQDWAMVWYGKENWWLVESDHPDWDGYRVSGQPVCPKCGGDVVTRIDNAVITEGGWLKVWHTHPVFDDWIQRN